MTILYLYFLVSAYLLGRLESPPHSIASFWICIFWLPAGLVYLSATLADKTLGDHPDR
ncbi:MFS transporter permease [Pantoea ananatis]